MPDSRREGALFATVDEEGNGAMEEQGAEVETAVCACGRREELAAASGGGVEACGPPEVSTVVNEAGCLLLLGASSE
eukprot:980989-Rhodomonas_salina.2